MSRPFHGPYRVLTVTPTNVEVRLVSDPRQESIFVNLDRIRSRYPELEDDEWIGPKGKMKAKGTKKKSTPPSGASAPEKVTSREGPVTRSMTKRH